MFILRLYEHVELHVHVVLVGTEDVSAIMFNYVNKVGLFFMGALMCMQ